VKQTLLILVSSMLVNNLVLVKFLGLCPFMGVSRRQETALGMGLATTFVLTLSSVLSHFANTYLLVPLNAEYLRTIVFIVLIAVVVQFTEQMVRRTSPLLTNCAVLGVALLNVQASHTLIESFAFGFGASLGFTLVLVLFSGIRERLEGADVPKPFQGSAIGLITAGLMSVAFMGFAGLIRS